MLGFYSQGFLLLFHRVTEVSYMESLALIELFLFMENCQIVDFLGGLGLGCPAPPSW